MKRVYLLSESEARDYVENNLPEMCIVVPLGYEETSDHDEDSKNPVPVSSLNVYVVRDDSNKHYVCVSSIPNKLDWMKYANELWIELDGDVAIYDEHGVVKRDGEVELEGESDFDGRNIAIVSMYADELAYRLKEPILAEKTLVCLSKPWNGHKKQTLLLLDPQDIPPCTWRWILARAGERIVSTRDLNTLKFYGSSVENTTPYVVLVDNE